ncbi:MAG: histone H1 [Bacteroidales bacterium]|nr:histone H1 [Bacteroidales bacterium]
MKKLVKQIDELFAAISVDANKAVAGNKTAGARARKASIELEKVLKEFRKVSIAESKK